MPPQLENVHPAFFLSSKYINHRYNTKLCLIAEHPGFVTHTSRKLKSIILINEMFFKMKQKKKLCNHFLIYISKTNTEMTQIFLISLISSKKKMECLQTLTSFFKLEIQLEVWQKRLIVLSQLSVKFGASVNKGYRRKTGGQAMEDSKFFCDAVLCGRYCIFTIHV